MDLTERQIAMLDMLGDAVGVVGAVGGFVAGAVTIGVRLKRAKKEVTEFIVLTQQLIDKYDEVDDDAKRLRKEAAEAMGAVKAVFKIA